jgi:hypothetical protein
MEPNNSSSKNKFKSDFYYKSDSKSETDFDFDLFSDEKEKKYNYQEFINKNEYRNPNKLSKEENQNLNDTDSFLEIEQNLFDDEIIEINSEINLKNDFLNYNYNSEDLANSYKLLKKKNFKSNSNLVEDNFKKESESNKEENINNSFQTTLSPYGEIMKCLKYFLFLCISNILYESKIFSKEVYKDFDYQNVSCKVLDEEIVIEYIEDFLEAVILFAEIKMLKSIKVLTFFISKFDNIITLNEMYTIYLDFLYDEDELDLENKTFELEMLFKTIIFKIFSKEENYLETDLNNLEQSFKLCVEIDDLNQELDTKVLDSIINQWILDLNTNQLVKNYSIVEEDNNFNNEFEISECKIKFKKTRFN